MALRVSDIRLPPDREDELLPAALRKAGLQAGEVEEWRVVRRSLDRRRRALVFHFTVDLVVRGGDPDRIDRPGVAIVRAREWAPPAPGGGSPLLAPPAVVGTGPAGLLAGLLLARAGYRPVLFERGDKMNARAARIREINTQARLDPESNYLFGEGGAGTYSDGKLTSRSRDPRASFVLGLFREYSGVDRVGCDYRPHLGSDRVRAVTGRIRQEILALGGRFHFRTRVDRIRRLADGYRLEAAGGCTEAGAVVLAPGHSARDLLRTLARDQIPMAPKPFQLGLRIEHPQSWVDRRIWGAWAGRASLGPADYRLSVTADGGREIYSFCMCPGGEIIPATADPGQANTNGMSWSGRGTGFANSGLVGTFFPEDLPDGGLFAGMDLQESLERAGAEMSGGGLRIPAQRLPDFLEGRPSAGLPPGSARVPLAPADLGRCLPPGWDALFRDALRRMDGQMPGFLHPEGLLAGPEARSSCPVRILRDPATLCVPGFDGLYPAGEGAGYAGGIVSAAVDGVRAAEALLRVRSPPRSESGTVA